MKTTKKKKRDLWNDCEKDLRVWAKLCRREPEARISYTHAADMVRIYAKEAKRK